MFYLADVKAAIFEYNTFGAIARVIENNIEDTDVCFLGMRIYDNFAYDGINKQHRKVLK